MNFNQTENSVVLVLIMCDTVTAIRMWSVRKNLKQFIVIVRILNQTNSKHSKIVFCRIAIIYNFNVVTSATFATHLPLTWLLLII